MRSLSGRAVFRAPQKFPTMLRVKSKTTWNNLKICNIVLTLSLHWTNICRMFNWELLLWYAKSILFQDLKHGNNLLKKISIGKLEIGNMLQNNAYQKNTRHQGDDRPVDMKHFGKSTLSLNQMKWMAMSLNLQRLLVLRRENVNGQCESEMEYCYFWYSR